MRCIYGMGTIYFLILWFLKENIWKLSIEKTSQKPYKYSFTKKKVIGCKYVTIPLNEPYTWPCDGTTSLATPWTMRNTYVVLYGICVHLHYTLHFSLLLKVTIATENLRSKISHKNQRSKVYLKKNQRSKIWHPKKYKF